MKNIVILLALGITVAVPFVLRPKSAPGAGGVGPLVIISPHNQAVRDEFEYAFRQWHQGQFGTDVKFDWRNVGGTSEIVRYLDGEFEAADRVQQAGIGIDLFFGGGQYDHARQAKRGHTAACGLRQRHPEWLKDEIIPLCFSGELFYDRDDRWYGCCLTSFGICYNEDVLAGRGLTNAPADWMDLADFRLFRQVALADPTKSGSINKAFEMLIQEQMTAELAERSRPAAGATAEDLAAGWRRALSAVRVICANARYFTDSAGKVTTDVSQGNAAAGMCIDYYGRFESEFTRDNEHSTRMQYFTPPQGSSISVDPISLLRGAPHRELAERFIDFCLSAEGQRLWNYRAGEPGGPRRHALRRLPIRRDMYTPEHLRHMSDPEALPYQNADAFVYRPEWTGALFSVIRLLIRSMCLDTHDELSAAWAAIHRAGGPQACPEAMRALTGLPPSAEYDRAGTDTAQRINNKLDEVRLAREWVVYFRNQYRLAESLAEAKVP